ncbi:DUF502 domain-containing protein [Halorarum salinum]|uniref:DUF502 domain-containing protein n=1 Tax=Halorarum salinum TaxID=2743089 RepID=A0A7D5QI40_9EURY|nr:DUF502 domain-containing protein [Halobaculum salinum]QLG62684.1 DUF502 domain-containing protein [Halobaculum salinum]
MQGDWSARTVGRSVRTTFRGAFVTGVAVIVPLVITAVVLAVAGRYVYTYLDLFSTVVLRLHREAGVGLPVGNLGFVTVSRERVVELLTPVVLLSLIFVVGLFVNSTRFGGIAIDYFDAGIAAIPAVGSVYESFRRMSDVMLEDDTQNFRDVKLVEFPHEGAYTLGFVTTETPEALRVPAGHERMLTLFLPLAPNPVMGGHLVHMPAGKVKDVDMTVEEGIRAIVTSGVAVSGGRPGSGGLSESELRELSAVEHADQQLDPDLDSPDLRRGDDLDADRDEEWDRHVSPERSTTPADVARRTRTQRGDPDDDVDELADAEQPYSLYGREESSVTPAREAGRYDAETDAAEEQPAAAADRDPELRDRPDRPPAEAAGRSDSDGAGGGTPPEEVTDGSDLDGDEATKRESGDRSDGGSNER